LKRRLLASAVGCVLALLVCELVLRLVGYAGELEREQRVFDRRYGTVARDSWIWNFAIDPARHRAVDLRGQLVPLQKPPGETRVLFLGDSATEGAFVGLPRSYPRRFEALLRAARPETNVRAINAGVWGMTTIDEYHLLRDKLLPLRPDVVVLGLFMANDLNFNLAHREHRARIDGAWDWLRTHSALVHFVALRWLASARQAPPGEPNAAGWRPMELRLVEPRGLHLLSYPEGELATYALPPSEHALRAYEVLAHVLSDFVALGVEAGFRFEVLLIPSPSRVLSRLAILAHPELLRELEARGVRIRPQDIDVDAPTRRVLAVCSRLGIRCMDPTARLRRLGARAFFPHDEHPTALGHEALAEELLAH
jgi:lysophospholipase L1-like esterase